MMGKVNYPGLDLHGHTVEILGEDMGGDPRNPTIPVWLVKAPGPHGIYGCEDDVIGLPKDRVRILAEASA